MASDAQGLIAELTYKGVLQSPAVIRALEGIDRADFVPQHLRHLAYEDIPLPIGSGQTISQPFTVAFMLEQLDVRPGARVFEVGYGSGWQTALLAHMVGPRGFVYAMEVVPQLCATGAHHLERYPELLPRVRLYCRNATRGCEEGAPFDRIIAAAETPDAPAAWRDQLRIGGQMLYPKRGSLALETKEADGFAMTTFPGFLFVPLT